MHEPQLPCDWELRMRKVARSFFLEEGVIIRDMDIRGGNVRMLEADIGSAVPAGGWLHLNAGRLPYQDGSKANRRRDPARLPQHRRIPSIQPSAANQGAGFGEWWGKYTRQTPTNNDFFQSTVPVFGIIITREILVNTKEILRFSRRNLAHTNLKKWAAFEIQMAFGFLFLVF